MALTKIKLGSLIELCDEKNADLKYGIDSVRGISTQKFFINTKADMDGVSLHNYRVVKPNEFAYVADTSRRGDKISLAYNNTSDCYIVSSISTVFRVNSNRLNPYYLFMYFNRSEFDRYSRFNSWGSARETFSWEDMCDIDMDLPDIQTQQKYVDIYLSMHENQKAYERGLEDLKLVCDGYIEDLRRNMPCEEIGKFIEQKNIKNFGYKIKKVLGISKDGFITPKQDVGDLKNYFVFEKDDFVYSPPRINIGSIGLYKEKDKAVCSPIYVVFKSKDTNILFPEYLAMWFQRSEFLRSTDFFSISSVRNNFSFESMQEVKIPIPPIKVQNSVADIYKCYMQRKEINEKLKQQIKDICSILIKGSLEEAR